MKTRQTVCCSITLILLNLGALPPASHAETPTAPNSARQVKQETRELLQALKTYTVEQRAEAIRKTQTALDHLDQRLEVLEKQIDRDWEKMDQAAREKARASQKELRRQRTQAAEWYGSLKHGSLEAWEEMKKGFAEAFRDLHEAWEKSEQEFGADN